MNPDLVKAADAWAVRELQTLLAAEVKARCAAEEEAAALRAERALLREALDGTVRVLQQVQARCVADNRFFLGYEALPLAEKALAFKGT